MSGPGRYEGKPKATAQAVAQQINDIITPLVERVEEWRVRDPVGVPGAPGVTRRGAWTDAHVPGAGGAELAVFDAVAEVISLVAEPLGLRLQRAGHDGWMSGQRHYRWEHKRGKEHWLIWMPCYRNEYGEGRHRAHIQVTFDTRGRG